MSVDPTVILALSAAADADPANAALRTHLASLLYDAGRYAESLEYCRFVLSRQPDDLEALAIAARAAESVGDSNAAAGYRKLYEALGWKQTKGLLDDLGGGMPPNSEAPETPPLDDRLPPNAPDKGARVPVRGKRGENEDEQFGDWDTEKVTITLADVAGMEDVKRRLNLAFLGPLKNPEMMRLYGKSLRGGLLLYGPPGCGKTYVAKATAGELGAKFLAIGLSDVLDMWLGESERKLHEIFELARRNRPCVLFF